MTTPDVTQVCLLRHAHAGDPLKWTGPDDIRPLTEKGRLQSQRLALFLTVGGFRPDAILTSPKTRSLETARMVAAPFGPQVKVIEALGGPLDVESLEEILSAAGDPRRPILVGHDPDYSMLAAQLTGAPELPIRKATLVRIDCLRPLQSGQGILRWLLPPDLLSGKADD